MRFAVWGAQHYHLSEIGQGLIKAGWECAGVAEKNPAAVGNALAKELNCPLISDGKSFLKRGDIDLIVTAAVPVERKDIFVASLKAGIPVFADKPLVTSLEQLKAVRKAAAASGKGVWAFFALRWLDATYALKKLIDSGEIGKPVAVEAARPHRLGREPSHLGPAGRPEWMFNHSQYGGVLNDLVCHDIDLYLWLTGAHPDWVMAEERATRYGETRGGITDLSVVLMGGCDVAGYFRGDWLTPAKYPLHGDCWFRVVGTEGVAEARWSGDVAKPGDPDIVYYSDKTPPTVIKPTPGVAPNTWQELTAHIRDGKPMALTPEETFRATFLTLSAVKSAAARKLISGLSSQL
jgi:predicted dehydrogenase